MVKPKALNKRGVTLVEVMVASALLAVCLFGAFKLANHMSAAHKSVAVGSDFMELANEIQNTVSAPVSCGKNLEKVRLQGDGEEITIHEIKADGSPGDPIAGAGSKYKNVEVTSLKLVPFRQMARDRHMVKLVVKGKPLGQVVGPGEYQQEIPVFVQANPGNAQVRDCLERSASISPIFVPGPVWPSETPSSVPSVISDSGPPSPYDNDIGLNNRICDVSSGGAMRYDPNEKKCVEKPIHCYADPRPDRAKCRGDGPGHYGILAFCQAHGVTAESPPRNLVDLVNDYFGSTRGGGSVSTFIRAYDTEYDEKNQECICKYAETNPPMTELNCMKCCYDDTIMDNIWWDPLP